MSEHVVISKELALEIWRIVDSVNDELDGVNRPVEVIRQFREAISKASDPDSKIAVTKKLDREIVVDDFPTLTATPSS